MRSKLAKERVENNHSSSLRMVRTALHKLISCNTSQQDSNQIKELAKISNSLKVLLITRLSAPRSQHCSLSNNNLSVKTWISISSPKTLRPLPLVSLKIKGIIRSKLTAIATNIERGVLRAPQLTTFKRAPLNYLQKLLQPTDLNRPITLTVATELSPVNVREGQMWWISSNTQIEVAGHQIINSQRQPSSSKRYSRRRQGMPWKRFDSITSFEMTTLHLPIVMSIIMIHPNRVSIRPENSWAWWQQVLRHHKFTTSIIIKIEQETELQQASKILVSAPSALEMREVPPAIPPLISQIYL